LISKVITYVSVVVIGIAIIYLGIRFTFGTYNPFYVVASGSMIPALNISDFVIINHNIPFMNLKVGDIIVFKSPGSLISNEQHETIVHRVAHISTDIEGNRIIRTKGDANDGSIPYIDTPIRDQNYIGKVVYDIPKLGVVTKVISPPTNYIIIGVLIIMPIYYSRFGRREEQKRVR
jgi:signal peptidase